MAHALKNYQGDCANIHGHSYELDVTVIGLIAPNDGGGMVTDFKKLKSIVQEYIIDVFDHSLVMNAEMDAQQKQALGSLTGKVHFMPFNPTSENMLTEFVSRLEPQFRQDISLHHLKLRETANCFAEWYAGDNADSVVSRKS